MKIHTIDQLPRWREKNHGKQTSSHEETMVERAPWGMVGGIGSQHGASSSTFKTMKLGSADAKGSSSVWV